MQEERLGSGPLRFMDPRREAMLEPEEVSAILRLKELGWDVKRISRELGISRIDLVRICRLGIAGGSKRGLPLRIVPEGTIRAVRVKLQNGGAVEGDIFHRSLSIDENSQFEGSSLRVENPIDSSSVDARGPRKKDMQNPAPAPLLSSDAELTEGPKC
jgi:hypothetical protein